MCRCSAETLDEIREAITSSIVVKKRKRSYYNAVTSIDIEVYSDPKTRQGSMYIWQFCAEHIAVYGRTWDEYLQLVHMLQSLEHTTVIYVHNLSYEFQFLLSRAEFDDVFAVQPRKVLFARTGNIEYRCSYKLTNMSLAAAAAKYNKTYQKQSGEDYDYDKPRDSTTPMTEEELKYCEYDVRAVVELVHALLDRDRDTLATIPLTSTGYVRRDAKHALHGRRRQLAGLTPDPDLFAALREAFRGGNTHSNRYLTGHIINNVHSADRSSSYPDVLCNEQYPMTPFIRVDPSRYAHYLGSAAVIMRVAFKGIHCNWDTTLPYLSYSKCRKVYLYTLDNGRILDAEYLECTMTDIDYGIMLRLYTWEQMVVTDCWVSAYEPLPPEMIDLNIEYYRRKTTLKGVDGQELYYHKSKEALNSIYGMCAQNPVHDTITVDREHGWTVTQGDPIECLQQYKRSGFVPYQWAVWCTSHARNALQWGIDRAGENFVYADTDSVKYTGNVDWTPYNNDRITRSTRTGAFADDPSGQRHYMGVYEIEQTADRFITLGAKRYAYEAGNKLHLTISGVNKEQGALELAERGGLDVFQDGFVFRKAGRLTMVYNDEYPTNIYAEHSDYTMSLSHDYRELLDAINGKNADIEYTNETF